MSESRAERSVKSAWGIRSPVYWAQLGLVIERPGCYAYQLARLYERVYGEALPVSGDSHIYKALDVLQAKGLIETIPEEALELDGYRQPRPRYRATEEGVRSYHDWLRAQVGKDRRQARLFARQLGALVHHPAVALDVIACWVQGSLEEASHAPARATQGTRPEGSELADELASRESRLMSGAKLETAEFARSRFEEFRQRETRGDGPAAGA
jgi:DNA-binding PadR family transcriptional regulator